MKRCFNKIILDKHFCVNPVRPGRPVCHSRIRPAREAGWNDGGMTPEGPGHLGEATGMATVPIQTIPRRLPSPLRFRPNPSAPRYGQGRRHTIPTCHCETPAGAARQSPPSPYPLPQGRGVPIPQGRGVPGRGDVAISPITPKTLPTLDSRVRGNDEKDEWTTRSEPRRPAPETRCR